MGKTYGGSLGVSVEVREPLPVGTRQIDTITDTLTSYSHDLQTFGGYDKARLSFVANRSVVEDWLEYGLGRRIVTFDEAGAIIWEGFTNRISTRLGGLSYAIGPLLEVTNYVRAVFSPFAINGQGVQTTTSWAQNAESIAKYGRMERVLSLGTVDATQADQIRDTYLAEHSQPESSREMAFDNSGGGVSVSLECLGYFHWLGMYKYIQTASSVPVSRDTLIALVLSADPNGYIDPDTAGIASNASLVQAVWNNNDKAIDVIKSVVAGGDSSSQRYEFGIYAGRKARYGPVSTEVDYLQYVGSPAQEFANPAGQIVKPWHLQPARWLFFPDFMVGRVQPDTELANDPRALFIQSVSFTAPWSVSVSGSKVGTLEQKVARLGLSGVSA